MTSPVAAARTVITMLVGIGIDAEFQVSAAGTQVIAQLLGHGLHAMALLALGDRRGGGTGSGRHGAARFRDRLGGRCAGFRTNGLGIHVASSK